MAMIPRSSSLTLGSVLLLLVAALLTACPGGSDDPADVDAAADAGPDGGPDSGVDAALWTEVVVVHTSDEHGWLQPYQDSPTSPIQGGAANIVGWWTEIDGFDASQDLLLSSGDNWTGPSISTWFAGEPTVAAFNLMGYHASAVGNHEFDFGRDGLLERVAQADYPYLAGNIRFTDTGQRVDFAEPWTMLEAAGGLQVGVLGLTTTSTGTSAHPAFVGDLTFDPLAATIDELVPQMRAAGADVVIGLAHACVAELAPQLQQATEPLDLVLAGHCHDRGVNLVADTVVMSSGWAWQSYGRAVITYHHPSQVVFDVQAQVVDVLYGAGQPNPVTPDPDVAALVAYWQGETDAVLSTEIGYTVTGITQHSWAQANWATDSWRAVFPEAQLAIQNFGGLRQSVPVGAITVGDVVSMMPFDNTLYLLELTGQQVLDNLDTVLAGCVCPSNCCPAVSGMTVDNTPGDVTATLEGGTPLDPAATYTVLVQDYIYWGGGGYLFYAQDPSPVDLGVSYRQPVIDWTAAQATSAASPLEDLIDPNPRVL